MASVTAELTRQEMGVRCATFLAERYERPRAKMIARDLGIAPATAKELLAKKPPSTNVIIALTNRFGAAFHNAIFGPALGWHGEAAMLAELDELQRRAADLRKRMDAANELRAASLPEGDASPFHPGAASPSLADGDSGPNRGRRPFPNEE